MDENCGDCWIVEKTTLSWCMTDGPGRLIHQLEWRDREAEACGKRRTARAEHRYAEPAHGATRSVQMDISAAQCEMVAADYLGSGARVTDDGTRTDDVHERRWPDIMPDVQVRSTPYLPPKGRLLLTVEDADQWRYLLVRVRGVHLYELVGWAWGWEAKVGEMDIIRNSGGGDPVWLYPKPSYWPDYEKYAGKQWLHSMDTFVWPVPSVWPPPK